MSGGGYEQDEVGAKCAHVGYIGEKHSEHMEYMEEEVEVGGGP